MSKRVILGYNAGYFVWSSKEINNNNFYLLNGQNLVRNGNRVEFLDAIEVAINERKQQRRSTSDNIIDYFGDYFCTEEEYNQSIAKYNTCGKFVWYPNDKMLKVPKTSEQVEAYIETNNVPLLEDYIERGYSIDIINVGIGGWNVCKYLQDLKIEPTNIVKPTKGKPILGYMYLLINNLDLEFYLDDEIPNVLIRKK